MKDRIRISPSILSADFGRLAEEVAAAEEAGADWIHVDVMDGHFVPNITIGPAVTEAVRRATTLPVDVHLMIEDPQRYIEEFVSAGADLVTVHQEACPHLHRVLEAIREAGARPGVAINPATPAETLLDAVSLVDLVLVMTVNPGFGGQGFIRGSLAKLDRLSAILRATDMQNSVHVQVDGGISDSTAGPVVGAGADVLVAGSAVFRSPDGVAAAIERLRTAVRTSRSVRA